MTTLKRPKKKAAVKKDIAASYNAYKFYKGKQYTGMAIGRKHNWNYDAGVWTEQKVTPDRWNIHYEVIKRRKGRAPEGSGVPVGTEYHWFILSHQLVKKLDANSYTTEMNGVKLKLAHKRSSTGNWSISDRTQRNHLIKILQDYIEELKDMDLEEFIESETNVVKKSKQKENVSRQKAVGRRQLAVGSRH
jgi:hypothetical protein